MWPKALAQLLELLPHVSRLVPVADRFLQSKAAGDEATRQALERASTEQAHKLEALAASLAEAASAANAAVVRELQDQSAALGLIAADARAIRKAMDFQDARLLKLEERSNTTRTLVVLAILQLALVISLIVILVLNGHLHV